MDPMLIIIAIALAAFVFFQFRNSRKRQRETAERQTQIVVGAEVMTNYGLYGTILSLDDDTNMALIESTPGTVLKIHRQTILKVVEPDVPVVPEATAEAVSEPEVLDAEPTVEPEFGERTDTPTKPARKSAAKKTRE
ncbi:MAG TPA: preprotein translocase subunit YajC [Terrimesophilobacter sp.]|nr:preprotein translocase subunit YajC [Terrimesophilobacter sp.]